VLNTWVTREGRDIAGRAIESALKDAPQALRSGLRSIADLDRIAFEVTQLRGSVPDGDLIFRTEPDELNNRIIVTITSISDRLLEEIATRFGTDAVAVRVDPEVAAVTPTGRQDDASPFYGGSDIRPPGKICSSGFAWRNGSLWQGILTAGHCVSNGGDVSTPVDFIGTTAFENWTDGSGTQSWPGEPGYFRGDLGLIKVASNKSVSPRIWRDGPNSNTWSTVELVWQRWSRPNDNLCTGGQTTGELCEYTVTAVGIQAWYILDGFGTWARNVVEAARNNYTGCIDGGDSGGSVFTLYGTGVAAKGIVSGKFQTIGTCFLYFTDIQHADQSLPGGVWASP
jgi:hypothetical protein